jgi:hypothetical protein
MCWPSDSAWRVFGMIFDEVLAHADGRPINVVNPRVWRAVPPPPAGGPS